MRLVYIVFLYGAMNCYMTATDGQRKTYFFKKLEKRIRFVNAVYDVRYSLE